MRELSSHGQQAINDLAGRTGFSHDAVLSMLDALIRGNGTMAQFDHAEFGGHGQWMRGGMTMLSDMFNNHLKGRVEGLCLELSNLIASQPDLVQTERSQPQSDGGFKEGASLFAPGTAGDWWPSDLPRPNSTGAQNGVRYAYFAQARRLAIDVGGRVTVYDTLDHRIGGFSQQQSDGASISFTSQHGPVDVAALPVVSGKGAAPPRSPSPPMPKVADQSDIFGMIEKLAALQAKGILSAEEFATKKAELLGRL